MIRVHPIIEELRVLRQVHGLSQVDYAKLVGVTNVTVDHYESGAGRHGNPSLRVLNNLAQPFGAELALFDLTDGSRVPPLDLEDPGQDASSQPPGLIRALARLRRRRQVVHSAVVEQATGLLLTVVHYYETGKAGHRNPLINTLDRWAEGLDAQVRLATIEE